MCHLKVRAKIEGIERLLPGIDSLAVVSTRPHLLGFDIRRNVSLKVSRLRVLFGPQTDLAVAVTRCPSLLTMSSHTAAGKLEKLQEALPSGLDARYGGGGGEEVERHAYSMPPLLRAQRFVVLLRGSISTKLALGSWCGHPLRITLPCQPFVPLQKLVDTKTSSSLAPKRRCRPQRG